MTRIIMSFMLLILSFHVVAKTNDTTCRIAPTYDIIVTLSYVQFKEDNVLIQITKNGQIKRNQHIIPMSPQLRSEAQAFEQYVRRELPQFKTQLNFQLQHLYLRFKGAIEKRLGNDSRLLNSLDQFYRKLNALMRQTIYEKGDILYFDHIAFNQLVVRGEQVGKGILASTIADSVIHFKLIKNYQAVHTIAKEEWKVEKPKLKAFNEKGCALFETIDVRYRHIKTQLLLLE